MNDFGKITCVVQLLLNVRGKTVELMMLPGEFCVFRDLSFIHEKREQSFGGVSQNCIPQVSCFCFRQRQRSIFWKFCRCVWEPGIPIRSESTVDWVFIVIEFNAFRCMIKTVEGTVILILRTWIQPNTPDP